MGTEAIGLSGRQNLDVLATEMYELATQLFPICRSITGEGVRETLRLVGAHAPLDVHEVTTGTPAFDWTVPREWNIKDAYIRNAAGERVVDFRHSNLHVMGYSIPVRARMTLEELRPHLHSLVDQPDWIPYRTSYYTDDWGFCVSHRQLAGLEDGEYEVFIDSTLEDGALTYGELLLPGESRDEILLHTHVCHPSLANDNVSGIACNAFLARILSTYRLRYSYRFVFVPGTIGALVWLSRNTDHLADIRGGIVVNNVGDRGTFSYKRSRRGDATIDRAASHVLTRRDADSRISDFSPFGYDERQYCSPGFDLPVGAFSRSSHGMFPEYHTSADNLDLVQPAAMAESLATLLDIIEVIEGDGCYENLSPYGEPQLGRRGLYRAVGGAADLETSQLALLWVLNLSDGGHSLLDIVERSGLEFTVVRDAAHALAENGLLTPVSNQSS